MPGEAKNASRITAQIQRALFFVGTEFPPTGTAIFQSTYTKRISMLYKLVN